MPGRARGARSRGLEGNPFEIVVSESSIENLISRLVHSVEIVNGVRYAGSTVDAGAHRGGAGTPARDGHRSPGARGTRASWSGDPRRAAPRRAAHRACYRSSFVRAPAFTVTSSSTARWPLRSMRTR